MHFVGCPRPHGSLETAPRAGLLPYELVNEAAESSETATTWESYWDEDGRYLVRAVTAIGDAWFSLVDEPESAHARVARPTPRAARVIALPGRGARRLMFVGARRRDGAAGSASSLMLVGRRPGAGSRRSSVR